MQESTNNANEPKAGSAVAIIIVIVIIIIVAVYIIGGQISKQEQSENLTTEPSGESVPNTETLTGTEAELDALDNDLATASSTSDQSIPADIFAEDPGI